MKRNLFLATIAAGLLLPFTNAQPLTLPNAKDSFHFAVVGDTGTGGAQQREIGADMAAIRATFPFDAVVMMGDNLYGGESPNDFKKKFEQPFAALLGGGVKFYASLGNHDNANQRFYKNFNRAVGLAGERAGRIRIGLEDRILSSSALFIRPNAWFVRRSQKPSGTNVPETRGLSGPNRP
jgi:hypothetical protein